MRLREDESGQTLVLSAVCMGLLMGFLALAVDVGLLFGAKRNMQTAADAGAVNAAAELSQGDWSAAAKAATALNGFTNGANGVTVTVNSPPTLGAYKGTAGYVEVILSQTQQTFFMRVFGRSSMAVDARAVAQAIASATCIYTLNSSAVQGVSVTGGASLTLPGCGIVDDATGSTALYQSGAASIIASSIGVVGTADITRPSCGSGNCVTPTPTTIPPVSDPLSSVTPPPASDYSSGCTVETLATGTFTIGPSSSTGYVCYSSFTISKGSPTVTLNPGLYILTGPMSIGSGGTFTGSGVTFYLVRSGSFTISNGVSVNLSAPTSGSYNGLLFYQDPNDTNADSFVGGSSATINGIFYLPAASLTLENGNSSTFSTDLVVGTLSLSGAATLNPYAPLSGASPLSVPNLAE